MFQCITDCHACFAPCPFLITFIKINPVKNHKTLVIAQVLVFTP